MQSMVNEILETLKITNENFIGTFLYGSQNYGLDYEGSDIDTITIILESEKAKQELTLKNGKAKIYTLKYFLYRLKQGDLECYEIMYTKHNIINSIYANEFSRFVQEFSKCMNYERIKNSLYKKLDEHLSHVLWVLYNPEKARYNKKRLYWALRVQNQLQRISDGEDFKSSLVYNQTLDYDLRKIKTITNHLSIKDFNIIYKDLIKSLNSLPRFSKDVLDIEEKCLSNFYANIINIKEEDCYENGRFINFKNKQINTSTI